MNAERRARLRGALVKAGREERATSARRANVLAIGAGVAVGATAATATTAAAASAKVSATAGASFAGWKMVVVAAGVLAATGVGAVGVAMSKRFTDRPRTSEQRMASPPQPVVTTTSIPRAKPVEMPTMSVADLPAAPAAKLAARPSTSTTNDQAAPPPPASSANSLADEMQSVDAIRSASREGRAGDALRLLDEHDARFPNGALAEETLVLRIETLARAGRDAEAKQLAERFVLERPKSPYAPRVRSTLSRLE